MRGSVRGKYGNCGDQALDVVARTGQTDAGPNGGAPGSDQVVQQQVRARSPFADLDAVLGAQDAGGQTAVQTLDGERRHTHVLVPWSEQGVHGDAGDVAQALAQRVPELAFVCLDLWAAAVERCAGRRERDRADGVRAARLVPGRAG